ncbi:MAG: hypothetical protein H6744_10045 [Deltaproteobacteria bacterium]|nr:hypothetical protein [Deltaproteobacteria bacterium]
MDLESAQHLFASAVHAEWRLAQGAAGPEELAGPGGCVSPEVARGLASMRPVVERRERVIFRVELRAKAIAAALVSEATGVADGTGKYGLRLLAAREVGEAPRVSRVDHVCTACVALGAGPLGEPCLECGGEGWEPWFGASRWLAVEPGPLEAVRFVAAPSSSLYLPEHRRARAAARRAGLIGPDPADP